MEEFKDSVDNEVECTECVTNFYNEILNDLNRLRNLYILDDESYDRAKMNLERLVFGVEY